MYSFMCASLVSCLKCGSTLTASLSVVFCSVCVVDFKLHFHWRRNLIRSSNYKLRCLLHSIPMMCGAKTLLEALFVVYM